MSDTDSEKEYERAILNKLIELSDKTKLLRKEVINLKKDIYRLKEDLQDVQPIIESIYIAMGSLKWSLIIINILMIISISSIVILTLISN